MPLIDKRSVDKRLQEIAYKQTAEFMHLIEEVLYVIGEKWLWAGELVDLVYFVDKLIALKFIPKPRYVNKFILSRFLWTKGTLSAESLKTARNRLGEGITPPDASLVLLFDLLQRHGTRCYSTLSLWDEAKLRHKYRNNIDKEARECFFERFNEEIHHNNINALSKLRERKASGENGLDYLIEIYETKVINK
jgi:hypothetical protein